MIKKVTIIFFVCLLVNEGFAKQPSITNIDPVNNYPSSTVFIAGSGFGTVVGDITVWFGGVEGTVVSVADNLIEVTVPANAPSDNITVLNTSTGLLARSREKFFLSHSGSTFNVSQLSAPTEFFASASQQLFDLCTCDFDNDGLADIATTISTGGTEIKLLKNTSTVGTLGFTEFTSADFSAFDTGFALKNIGCADLNGDGNIDIFASRNGQEKLFIFENTNTVAGTMSFSIPAAEYNLTPSSAPYLPSRIMASDLTGDGKPELVMTNESENSINILINQSTGGISFSATQEILTISGISNSSGLDLQDMDGDGRADLVITALFANDVQVLRNIGAGGDISFDTPQSFVTGPSVNVTTADYNNDGLLDMAAVDLSNNLVYVFENTSTEGSISFATAVTFATGSEPWVARSGDMNGDGVLDIVVSSRGASVYTVAINDGSLNFTPDQVTVARPTRNLNVQDYDNDGKSDIALTSFATNDYALLLVRNSNCYAPQILNDTPLAICATQTLTLTVPDAPGATFNWSKDATPEKSGPENFLDITTFGNYEVEVVSEGGSCTNTTSVNVSDGSGTVPGDPTASNDGPTCVGGNITLSVNTVAGATYSWTGPAGFTSTDQNPTITGVTTDNAGVYTVQIKSGDCLSSTDDTVVEVNQPPQFSASTSDPTTVCSGTSVQLITQNTAGFTYQWLRDGTDITGATGTTYNANTTGNYSVRVSETSSNCEVVTNAIAVTVFSQPIANFSISGSSCVGSDITLTSTSTVDGVATASYSWNFGDGNNGTGSSVTHNYASSGNYSVTLTVSYTSGAGCTADASTQGISVVDPETISIQASQAYVCTGESVDLSVPSTLTNISWSSGETTDVIAVTSEGTYSVTATDANGCGVSDSFDLPLGSVPNLEVTADGTAGDITVVSGTAVQLEATGADTYSWDPADFLDDPAIANPVATPAATTTYTVTGTLTDGCSATAQITLSVGAEREINIDPLKAFSPNSTIDPTWRVDGVENYPDCTMSIFDERGTLIFRQTGYNNEWDATFEGNPLPEGVYYYIFSCEELEPTSGSILVVR